MSSTLLIVGVGAFALGFIAGTICLLHVIGMALPKP
jgi:hypothetical protein